MHIAHVCPWRIPVPLYGGSERVVHWQAKAQAAAGHRVTLLARPGSACPGVEIIEVADGDAFEPHLPVGVEVVNLHGLGRLAADLPFVITTQGNSGPELSFAPQKVFVSRNHAERAGARAFVYNGVDPEEFLYRERKDDYLLFLSKVNRKVKGIDTALGLARRMGFKLIVAGGTRFSLRKASDLWDSLRAEVRFVGEVGGRRKAELLAGARALLFPIRWEEPFGIVVAEALISGTPVITTPRGAMPELVTEEVGFLCGEEAEMEEAIRRIGEISPSACRARALEHFTSDVCARKYLRYYERARSGLELEA